jgi:hypothetical protein
VKTVITRAEAEGMSRAELARRHGELLAAIPSRAELERMSRDELEYAKLSIEVQKAMLDGAETRALRRWWRPPLWVLVAIWAPLVLLVPVPR